MTKKVCKEEMREEKLKLDVRKMLMVEGTTTATDEMGVTVMTKKVCREESREEMSKLVLEMMDGLPAMDLVETTELKKSGFAQLQSKHLQG